MWLYNTYVFISVVTCTTWGWKIEDRNSEENDSDFKRERQENHLDNFAGLESFHVDKAIEGKDRTILFADCFDIDMGPLAKKSLRFVFNELAGINWTIDSVATSPKYIGKPVTKRMADFLRGRGQGLRGHRVRLITEDDFRKADWILAIDETTLEYLNKIKPKDSKALIEMWGNYDFYKDGDQKLLDINNMHCEDDYLESYWHNLRLAVMFLQNIRCKKCFPIDYKLSEKYWDQAQL